MQTMHGWQNDSHNNAEFKYIKGPPHKGEISSIYGEPLPDNLPHPFTFGLMGSSCIT